MKKFKFVYAIKSYDTDEFFKKFNGLEFELTDDISEAKYFLSESEALSLMKTTILGRECLPDCEVVRIKIAEFDEEDEEDED